MVEELAHYMTYENPGLGGEFIAYMALEGQVSAPCRCLWNLEVPKKNGHTQVDLLVIHTTGIYVLESKNYSKCRVCGDEKEKDWNVVYPKGRGFSMYSTYLQNEGHMEALRDYVDYPVPMKSIVVYGNRVNLQIKRTASSKTVYCHYNSLGNVMNEHARQRKPCLDDEEVWLLYQLLRPLLHCAEHIITWRKTPWSIASIPPGARDSTLKPARA